MILSTLDLTILKAHLEQIKCFRNKWDNRKLSAKNKNFGLCENLNLFVISSLFNLSFYRNFDIYTGEPAYPIPHPTTCPIAAYDLCYPKYDRRTEYGRNRYKYLLHIIDTLEHIIQKGEI